MKIHQLKSINDRMCLMPFRIPTILCNEYQGFAIAIENIDAVQTSVIAHH